MFIFCGNCRLLTFSCKFLLSRRSDYTIFINFNYKIGTIVFTINGSDYKNELDLSGLKNITQTKLNELTKNNIYGSNCTYG